MFGQDHEAEDVATRIDHLMEAVFKEDDDGRIERLARHLAPDFVYVSPEAVFEGPAEAERAFALYRRVDRRPVTVARTSVVDLHHCYFRYTWDGGARRDGYGRLELRIARRARVDRAGRDLRGPGARGTGPEGRPDG